MPRRYILDGSTPTFTPMKIKIESTMEVEPGIHSVIFSTDEGLEKFGEFLASYYILFGHCHGEEWAYLPKGTNVHWFDGKDEFKVYFKDLPWEAPSNCLIIRQEADHLVVVKRST